MHLLSFLSLGGIFLSLFWRAGMMNHPPIPISELAEHTELLKANDNLKLSQEYEVSVPKILSSKFLLRIDFCLIVLSLYREHTSSLEI